MPTNEKKEGVSKITLYKLKSDFPVSEALRDYKNQKQLTESGWKITMYTRAKAGLPPAWKPLVKDHISEDSIPTNTYASLVILLEKGEDVYALTSGYGYMNVREHAYGDFGIDIACKSIDPHQLNHLYQKTPTGSVYGWNRTLRGKYIPTTDHLNQRSVLKALKGKVINKEIGVTMEGKTSLAISGKKDLSDVVVLMDKIQEIEKSTTFTIHIKGLDEVSKDLKSKLDTELLEKVNSGSFDDVLFGYDDDLIFNNCEKIKVGKDLTEYQIDDTQGILSSAKNQSNDYPASVRVVGLDEQNQVVFEKKLIDLIEGEMDFENDKYFRIDKKWYKTNTDYINLIEEDFKKIERLPDTYLGEWTSRDGVFVTEDDFLKTNVGEERILAHTQKIMNIELADLVDKELNHFIHVKKGKGAFLRNLFAQGYVSGSLYSGDDNFKQKVKEKFEIDLNPRYTVVYAIFPEDETKINSIFTLFAKVDFLERCDSLRNMGFDVKYCLIQKQ